MKYPMDVVLGSPATVRLLRVLIYEVGAAVSVPEAARLAGLTQAGARRALERLQQIGIVQCIGSGRNRVYEVCADNPFVELLAQLFDEEYQRFQTFLISLRDLFADARIVSAWTDFLESQPADLLTVKLVLTPEGMGAWQSELRENLLRIEQKYGVIVELEFYLKADAPSMDEDALLLWGVPAQDAALRKRPKRAEVLAFVAAHPQVIVRAKRYLSRLLDEGQGTADADIKEWLEMLDSYSAKQIIRLLASDSERAQRLWRSEPFLPVLTNEEFSELSKFEDA
ncbi:MAG: hypothetical protein FWF11_01305 [Coriobacteriia bacterium]|nr:hypothetical protein [Coriobacteriia bacterium]